MRKNGNIATGRGSPAERCLRSGKNSRGRVEKKRAEIRGTPSIRVFGLAWKSANFWTRTQIGEATGLLSFFRRQLNFYIASGKKHSNDSRIRRRDADRSVIRLRCSTFTTKIPSVFSMPIAFSLRIASKGKNRRNS